MHKLYHILSHPAMMLASVSVLVIAGESSAGIFAQFFVMNLITLKLFAVVGAVGLLILIV
jgi:hypothetical protein